MTALRIGIVGCGRMGKERARCVSVSGENVTAVFDIDQERSRELSSRYSATGLACVEDFFNLSLDAIFICTAPGDRGNVEAQCIEAGLPIYVEKPIGVSVNRCEKVLLQLQQKPVINGVGYMNRYRDSVRLAKEVLATTTLVGFSAHWVCKRYNVPWWEVESASGGPHNEQATHLYDLCRFLVGYVLDVKSIFSGTSRVASALQCKGGVPGTVFYSCDGNEKAIGIEIFTNCGTITLSGWDFLKAVRLGQQSLVKSDFADAMETQAVTDAIRQSGREGRAVEVVRRDWNLAYDN